MISIIVYLKFMSNVKYLIIIILIISFSNFVKARENEIIFKISNKSFTTVDLDKRKEYLLFVGDNSYLSKEEIIEDFISVNLFKRYYVNSNIKSDLKDTIQKIYLDILKINYENNNSNLNEIDKENIFKNLELDLIRKLILENLLNGKEKNITLDNNGIDKIYNYKIEYINFTLFNLGKNKKDFLNTKFNNINEVESYLKAKNIPFVKKINKINNIEKINKVIKNNIYLEKNFFKIENNKDITFFFVNKEFQTHETLSLVLYSFKSNKKLNHDDIRCNLIENKNIESKEYEFNKLNENIKNSLININDFVEIINENSYIYVILCDLKFNMDIINNLILNNRINKLVDEYENDFIEKYSLKYNLIITNE